MILTLQRYNILVKYKKGTHMYLADTLSRAPESMQNVEKHQDVYKIEEEIKLCESISTIEMIRTGVPYLEERVVTISEHTFEKIKQETTADKQLTILKQQILRGWPNEKKNVSDEIKCYWNFRSDLTIEDGVVLKGNQILIPVNLRKEFLKRLHLSHLGIEATQKLARESVFWPNINGEIRDIVQSCETCTKLAANQKKIKMQSYETPKEPFEIVSMDVFEIDIKGKRRKFLVTVDHFSDFFEIDELKDLSSSCTILICKRNFSRHGIPKTVISDGATNFSSSEFQKFSTDWEFKHVMSSPHYPQSNGKAESAVKVVKMMIKKSIDSNEDFYKMLLAHRNTPNKINSSPSRRLMGRWLRCQLPNFNSLEDIPYSETEAKITENRKKTKKYYDKSATERSDLRVGENVWFKKLPESELWSKGTIEGDEGNRSYSVRTPDGALLRRNERFIKPNDISPVIEPEICNDEEPNEEAPRNEVVESEAVEIQDGPDNSPTSTPTPVSSNPARSPRPRRTRRVPARMNDYLLY